MMYKPLQKYLDNHKVKYNTIKHVPAYTAEEIAAAAHVPGKELAKTVIVKLDGKLAMMVEPAHMKVDLQALQELTGAKKAELAKEYEFQNEFSGCEVGAMPPIGELFDIDVYIDERLTKDDEIAFNAGTHSELVRMKFKDFIKLVKPKLVKTIH